MSGLWSYGRCQGHNLQGEATENPASALPTLTDAYYLSEKLGMEEVIFRQYHSDGGDLDVDAPLDDFGHGQWLDMMRAKYEDEKSQAEKEEVLNVMNSLQSKCSVLSVDRQSAQMHDRPHDSLLGFVSTQPPQSSCDAKKRASSTPRIPFAPLTANRPEKRETIAKKSNLILADVAAQVSHLRVLSKRSTSRNLSTFGLQLKHSEIAEANRYLNPGERPVHCGVSVRSSVSSCETLPKALPSLSKGDHSRNARRTISSEAPRRVDPTRSLGATTGSGMGSLFVRDNHHLAAAQRIKAQSLAVTPPCLMPSKARESRQALHLAQREYEDSCVAVASRFRNDHLLRVGWSMMIRTVNKRRWIRSQLQLILFKGYFSAFIRFAATKRRQRQAFVCCQRLASNSLARSIFFQWMFFAHSRSVLRRTAARKYTSKVFLRMLTVAFQRRQVRFMASEEKCIQMAHAACTHYDALLKRKSMQLLKSAFECRRKLRYRNVLMAKARLLLGE